MRFRVVISDTATRQLRKLPGDQRSRVARALRVLEEDPFRPRPKADIRAIADTEPRKHRLRIGDYRVVYAIVGREVKIIEVFIRGRGYR